MGERQTTAPGIEPVTLTEMKAHLRVDIDDEDDLITSLIVTARSAIEHRTRRQMITAVWDLSLPGFPSCGRIELPFSNLQSVMSIAYADINGDTQTLDTAYYRVLTDSDPGFVQRAPSVSWPTVEYGNAAPVTVRYTAGYGDTADDVPEGVRHAIKLLVGHYYWHRESVGESSLNRVPDTIENLIAQYRIIA